MLKPKSTGSPSNSWVHAYGVAVMHGEKNAGAARFADWYTDPVSRVAGWDKVTPVEAWDIYTYEY